MDIILFARKLWGREAIEHCINVLRPGKRHSPLFCTKPCGMPCEVMVCPSLISRYEERLWCLWIVRQLQSLHCEMAYNKNAWLLTLIFSSVCVGWGAV